MATWITLPSVSLTNGSNTVSVTGSIDLSAIKAGWALIISSNYVEIASGTSADTSGNSMLTLALPWDGSAVINQPAKIQPTGAPFLEGIAALEATNEYAIDVHNTLTEIATEDKDVTIKDPTGAEHTFASMLKNARLVKEIIQSGSDELASIVADIKSQLEKQAMSKTEFFALAEQRKRESAGSGFLEWGADWVNSAETVNQGLWGRASTYSNYFILGTSGNDTSISSSRTAYPIALVNGVTHKIQKTTHFKYNQINVPEAEKGTRSYDSATGEVIDYLTDIDPKYGDVAADLNEAVARNFEGLVKNGDFRDGIAHWGTVSDPTFTVIDGVANISYGGEVANPVIRQELLEGTPDNEEYKLSFEYRTVSGYIRVDLDGSGGKSDGNGNVISSHNTDGEWVKYSGTYTWDTDTLLRLEIFALSTASEVEIKNVSMRKTSNQPILSRQDYYFLETWHEKVSSKDIFCPLGNAQYGAGTSDEGVTLVKASTLDVGQGYSALGAWDTETEGYAAKWSELSTTEQRACLDNPDNNLYFDAEADELIHVMVK